MNNSIHPSQQRLAQIFGNVNMSDLPAMSNHVQELICLVGSRNVTAKELADVILKDPSLTAKVLQVVNSAYYNRGTPINTISRAVATVGIHALREIATAIAVIEEFIKSGVEKDGICKTLTQSYLSACFAKLLCKEKNLPVAPEECFIGALLHNLGKMVLLIYQPEIYRRIEEKMAQGFSEEYCAKIVMNGLSCAQIGMEMAIFWNFPDKIVLAMDSDPPKPKNEFDTDGYLLNLAVFSNRLITTICQQSNFDLTDLILQYQKIFSLEKPEAISLVEKSIEASEEVSETIRYGLLKLKLRSKIIAQSQDFPANRSNCTSSRVS